MLSRVAPWLASRKDGAGTGVAVRTLGGSDTSQLRDLARQDAVANVFILSHLESAGSAAPTAGGASILGVFDGGTLLGACWAGANLVPVQLDPELAGAVALRRAPLRAAGTPPSSARPTRCWPCTRGWNSSARRPMRSARTSRC